MKESPSTWYLCILVAICKVWPVIDTFCIGLATMIKHDYTVLGCNVECKVLCKLQLVASPSPYEMLALMLIHWRGDYICSPYLWTVCLFQVANVYNM